MLYIKGFISVTVLEIKTNFLHLFKKWSSVSQTCTRVTRMHQNPNFMAICLHLHVSIAVNTAPRMTPFGSRRGSGAAKWDYTAGYFRRSQWRGSACKRRPRRGNVNRLIQRLQRLRGIKQSNSVLFVRCQSNKSWVPNLQKTCVNMNLWACAMRPDIPPPWSLMGQSRLTEDCFQFH